MSQLTSNMYVHEASKIPICREAVNYQHFTTFTGENFEILYTFLAFISFRWLSL